MARAHGKCQFVDTHFTETFSTFFFKVSSEKNSNCAKNLQQKVLHLLPHPALNAPDSFPEATLVTISLFSQELVFEVVI